MLEWWLEDITVLYNLHLIMFMAQHTKQLNEEVMRRAVTWTNANMCCDLAGSVGNRQDWLWDIARKKKWISIFFLFFWEPLLITLEPLDRFKWGIQQNVPLQLTVSTSRKLKISHVRVPTDPARSHLYSHSWGDDPLRLLNSQRLISIVL